MRRIRKALLLGIALLMPVLLHAVERRMQMLNEAIRLTPAPEHGARLYRSYCMNCHGPEAHGNAAEVVPALAGQREQYLLKQLVDFVESERDVPQMHRLMACKALNEPRAWTDLTAYLSQLSPNEGSQVGKGRSIKNGRRIYTQVCAECHGKEGEGDVTGAVPALRGQHYTYLLLQLREFSAGHRKDMDYAVLEYIQGLSHAELEGVADYISSFRRPNRTRHGGEKH